MCAGPVWTLTGPSCGCQSSCSSPNLALVLSHTFWWRCYLVPVCSLATFSCEDWVLCLLWVQCLFQAFKEIKRQILHRPFSVCMYICSYSVCRVLSSVCVITRLYFTVHAYSAFPIPGPIASIQFNRLRGKLIKWRFCVLLRYYKLAEFM